MSEKGHPSNADHHRSRRAGRLVWAGILVFGSMAAGVGCGADGPTSTSDAGRRTYQANCASCHGDDLGGTSLGPPLLDPMYAPAQLSDSEFVDAIRNGVEESAWDFGPMPANGVLSDAQIDSIIAFVRAEQSGAGSTSP